MLPAYSIEVHWEELGVDWGALRRLVCWKQVGVDWGCTGAVCHAGSSGVGLEEV